MRILKWALMTPAILMAIFWGGAFLRQVLLLIVEAVTVESFLIVFAIVLLFIMFLVGFNMLTPEERITQDEFMGFIEEKRKHDEEIEKLRKSLQQ